MKEQNSGLIVAADSLDHEETIYAALQNTLRSGLTTFQIQLADGSAMEVFNILTEEELVEPCYHPDKTIIVESRRIGKQIVTEFGGIFIPWEDLKTMSLVVENDGKTIRFRS